MLKRIAAVQAYTTVVPALSLFCHAQINAYKAQMIPKIPFPILSGNILVSVIIQQMSEARPQMILRPRITKAKRDSFLKNN
jgi:hypothetical protein